MRHLSSAQAPPPHFDVAFAKVQTLLQVPQLTGTVWRSVSSSINPLQSLSTLSQISTPPFDSVHLYSQPLPTWLSISTQPAEHVSTRQKPPSHFENAFGTLQTFPQAPQFWGSVIRSAVQLPPPDPPTLVMMMSPPSRVLP